MENHDLVVSPPLPSDWGLPPFEGVVYRIGSNAIEAGVKRGVLCRFGAAQDAGGAK